MPRPPLHSPVSRILDASSLYAGAWPSPSGTSITGLGFWDYKNSVKQNWKSDPNKGGWLFPNDPPTRAFRSRGGVSHAHIGAGYTQTFYRSPFFGVPNDMFVAIACRYRSLVGGDLTPNWNGTDYVPCSEVKFYTQWRSDGTYDDDGNWVGETKRTASYLTVTITVDAEINFDGGVEIKAAGWEPEDEGFTQLADPNNNYMPAERGGLWSKEIGQDITADSITFIDMGSSIGEGVSFGARDDEIDKEVTMDLTDLDHQAYSPTLGSESPFFLTKATAELKVYFRLVGGCDENKCGFVGAQYNVTMKYENGTCQPKAMPDRYGSVSDYTISSSGDGSWNFDYTVSESTALNTWLEMGSETITLNAGESKRFKDFLLTSVVVV